MLSRKVTDIFQLRRVSRDSQLLYRTSRYTLGAARSISTATKRPPKPAPPKSVPPKPAPTKPAPTKPAPTKPAPTKPALPSSHSLFLSQLQRECSALLNPRTTPSPLTSRQYEPLTLYVDGSLRPTGAGAAVYIPLPDGSSMISKLHLGARRNFTSTTTEYWAALIALQQLSQMLLHGHQGRQFTVASDNLCAVNCLKKGIEKLDRNPVAAVVQRWVARIRSKHPHILLKFRHTPGHSRIPGNEQAHLAAKAAASGETSVRLLRNVTYLPGTAEPASQLTDIHPP